MGRGMGRSPGGPGVQGLLLDRGMGARCPRRARRRALDGRSSRASSRAHRFLRRRCRRHRSSPRGAPVDALVLLAAPATWLSYAATARLGTERILEEAGMALSEETLADPEPWFSEFESVTTERSIAGIRIPTLVVHGSADDVVPVDHARRLSERAPGADLRIIEGAGHQLRKVDAAIDVVFSWLDRSVVHR